MNTGAGLELSCCFAKDEAVRAKGFLTVMSSNHQIVIKCFDEEEAKKRLMYLSDPLKFQK